jgi:hypothetical protein
MNLIKKHLENESKKEKQNKYLIQSLESYLEKGDITFEQWVNSGRFVPKNAYMLEHPDAELNANCDSVVEYHGQLYIESINPKGFLVGKMSYTTLGNAELSLWDKESKKLFHNQ